MTNPSVELVGVSKSFTSAGPVAVNGVSLAVGVGEHVALVGPSGSGKTTVLRLVAGFLAPDAGRIQLGGRTVAGEGRFVPPEQRGVGIVFQDYALFPHLTARQNIAFGLHRLPAAERNGRVAEVLDLVGLAEVADRHPHQLSGGQQQRVALARALAPRPILVLLDEPFSSLDAGLRLQVRADVSAILRASGTSVLFVTHDQAEALDLGDRIVVLHAGRVEQSGAPEQVFGAPATRFVAEFLGPTDFLPGEVTPQGLCTELGLLRQAVEQPFGTRVDIALRPDDVGLRPAAAGSAQVCERHFQGAQILYRLRLPSGRQVHSLQPHTRSLPLGSAVDVLLEPGHDLAVFPAEGSA